MALALDLTRRILSLPYKLDKIIDFDLFDICDGNPGSNKRERVACFSGHLSFSCLICCFE